MSKDEDCGKLPASWTLLVSLVGWGGCVVDRSVGMPRPRFFVVDRRASQPRFWLWS
jgi:hypothetical protein